MTQKPTRITPRLPRGFEDRLPADIAAIDSMIARIKGVYERYGFDPVETPLFEYTEALGKFLPDTDRPNAGVFSLQDDDEQWLSLRYDLTAPLARYFAEHFDRLPKPFRSYRAGYVFRNEKPGPGRFRQFMQFDADNVGAAGPEADAEMCMMMADVMDALGLAGKYVVKVNNRKVLDGFRDAFGLSATEFDAQWLTVMRALDKFDRLGRVGVGQLLGPGRRDESGDFTSGAGLDDEQAVRLTQVLALRSVVDSHSSRGGINPKIATGELDDDPVPRSLTSIISEVARYYSERVKHRDARELKTLHDGLAELEVMASVMTSAGYDDGRIAIDPSVVRGLEYYTGPVFEIELTFTVPNEKGQPVVFGSVGGGGRYDGLVSRFRSEPVPATGFSIGVSRLATALKLTGNLPASEPVGPVVVLVLDKERTARYQDIVSRLRRRGVRAEMFLGNTKNMRKQLEYADKRNAPAVIIEGSDEVARGIVQIKDLIAGKEASKAIADNAEWKAERPGQFECSDAEIVDKVIALPAVAAYLSERN